MTYNLFINPFSVYSYWRNTYHLYTLPERWWIEKIHFKVNQGTATPYSFFPLITWTKL